MSEEAKKDIQEEGTSKNEVGADVVVDDVKEDEKETHEGSVASEAGTDEAEEKDDATEKSDDEDESKSTTKVAIKEYSTEVQEEAAIIEPEENDVLNGRGASVNAHKGNQSFRSLCFQRKPEFEAGNHAAKRRIATEIVNVTKALPGRFLKRKQDKGPWYELSNEKAILKACQVMRDFQRPDRVALREMAAASGSARKRQRTTESTPIPPTPVPAAPLDPIIENPFGVHDHDVLSGRGAFVNGHVGNQRFRTLSMERKLQFDAGNYAEKRALATEVVSIIRSLDPPGRFLRRVNEGEITKPKKVTEDKWVLPPRGLDGTWEELSEEKAIHKACQVMRDIQRPDRAGDKRSGFKNGLAKSPETNVKSEDDVDEDSKPSMTMLAETTAVAALADEAMTVADGIIDKDLGTIPSTEIAVKAEDEMTATAEV